MAGKGFFDAEFLQELKSRNDIVEIASQYFSLEKKGYDYWGCCPFHHEKTPSFVVHAVDQYFHCFGCGVSGDVVKLVAELESLPWAEAVKHLAARAKMELPETDFDSERTQELKKKKDRMLSVLLDTAKFYLRNLYSGKADMHLDYIDKRALTPTILKKFGIGASLDSYMLPQMLLDKGYTEEEIVESGACGKSEKGRLYDFQANRLIIPIINQFDQVIGFGGRILGPKQDGVAKYKNTRETALFNKRKTLYNVNLLKKYKQNNSLPYVIMVEGYMDAISLYQAGFQNVVASMGTSLTPDQARMLKRFSENVMISYDQDGAGQKADLRGLEILKDEHLNVKVVLMPEGEDPDDVVRKRGSAAYQTCLDSALPLVDYKIHSLEKSYDLSRMEDKRAFAQAVMPIIREADSEAIKEDLLRSVRDKTGFSYQALSRDLEKADVSVAEKKEEGPIKKLPEKGDAAQKAGRFLIAAVLFGMEGAKDVELSEEEFYSEVHKTVVRYILSQRAKGEKVRISDLFDVFGEEEAEFNAILDLNTEERLFGENAERYLLDCKTLLRQVSLRSKIEELTAAIAKESDLQRRRELTKKLMEATKALKHK